jgi:S-adenosylmethionine/arginine decarboxylase-like enzyme
MSHIFGKIDGVSIKTMSELELKMNQVVTDLKLTEVSRCFYQFEPFGATGVILLAESHFSMHTYPENECIYFDLFCCTPNFKENAGMAASKIHDTFRATKITWECIDRL